MYNHTVLSI